MLYTRKNGYGTIDINSERFQLGQHLYEAQVLFADSEAGPVDHIRIQELCRRYCELVNLVGELKSEYRVMLSVVEGKAEFREQ